MSKPKEKPIEPRRVAIVGAGLVGSLAAIYLANRGWAVDLYDSRPDAREEKVAEGQSRSINLALSKRGIDALYGTGLFLDQYVLENAVPMESRMIHALDGTLQSQPYGLHGECINSVDRANLNKLLLDAAEEMPHVALHFEHRLRRIDFEKMTLRFGVGGASEHVAAEEVIKKADFIIGCDGAHSTVRGQLMRATRVNFKQEYIEHGYCELSIPPGKGEFGEDVYKMSHHSLHIWPRHTFMMIALPNKDFSFTCTLFMPFNHFETIKTDHDLITFFEENFPDAIALIGEEKLKKDYFANPKGPLMSVKCYPYHHSTKCLIIGDAAHSMVPFYGQGMNCGFEDVRILNRILDEHNVPPIVNAHADGDAGLRAALERYTEYRYPDADAIVDLAMHNYIEMRSKVVSTSYKARRFLERCLNAVVPNSIVPLYTMVSFTTIRYSEAFARYKRQNTWMARSGYAAATTLLVGLGLTVFKYKHVLERTRNLW